MKLLMVPTRRKEARRPEEGAPLYRRYAPISVALHVVGFSLLSLPAVRQDRPIFAEPIYEVALVRWPEPNYEPPVPATPPKPESTPQKTVKAQPKPKDTVPVKTTKPKPKAESAPEPKTVEPPKVEKPSPAPAAEERPVSLGQVDQQDFRHDYYLELLRSILARSWDPPPGGNGILQASVHFSIQRDGTITGPEIVGSSGWSLYDRSALGAVLTARKLPPLPEAYAGDHLGLTVNFQRVGDQP